MLYVADAPERAAARAGGSQRQARGRDHRVVAVVAESRWQDAGLRAVRRRHRLEHLALPPRRGRQRSAGGAQVQQVLAGVLGARQLRASTTAAIRSSPATSADTAERGDDAGRPDVYFHKLDDAQTGGPAGLPGDRSSDARAVGAGHRGRALSRHRSNSTATRPMACCVQDLRKPESPRCGRCSPPGMRSTPSSDRRATSSISRPPTARRAAA